jgi:hypothetical protein
VFERYTEASRAAIFCARFEASLDRYLGDMGTRYVSPGIAAIGMLVPPSLPSEYSDRSSQLKREEAKFPGRFVQFHAGRSTIS